MVAQEDEYRTMALNSIPLWLSLLEEDTQEKLNNFKLVLNTWVK